MQGDSSLLQSAFLCNSESSNVEALSQSLRKSFSGNIYLLLAFQGYQFWSKADSDGFFTISNVRVGNYNLYAWVPGIIGDYKYDMIISISSGRHFIYWRTPQMFPYK